MCVIFRHRISFNGTFDKEHSTEIGFGKLQSPIVRVDVMICIQIVAKFRWERGMKKPEKYQSQNWLSLIHHFLFCFYWNYRIDKSDLFAIFVI